MTEQLGGDKAEEAVSGGVPPPLPYTKNIVIPNEAERNEESQRAELNLEN
jgi:hypothetical protein